MRRRVLLYCDGGAIPGIGMGHVRRCLLLARELKAHDTEVSFLTSSGSAVSDAVLAAGFRCHALARKFRPAQLSRTLKRLRPQIVVWDRLDTATPYSRAVKKSGALLVSLDDAGRGQKLADITINAMVTGGDTPYKGFDYAVLPPAPKAAAKRAARPVRSIMLSFGGYDHQRLSEKVLRALAPLDPRIRIDLVLGAASSDLAPASVARHGRRLRVHRAPADFSRMLANADLAVLAGGATLVEALHRGVPSLGIAQYAHQLDTLRRCEAAGAAVCLGAAREVKPAEILRRTRALIGDAAARRSLARNGRLLVDGLGLERVRKLATVVERLGWDSEFFGVNIAALHATRLNDDLAAYALKKCREDAVRCLYYLCDCHDPRSVMLAERHGFHFVDIRMTFQRALDGAPARAASPAGYTIRPARESDIPQLMAIAAESYVHSRYFFDRHFPNELCRRFYANWIEKACRGYADVVLVAARGSRVLGNIACNLLSSARASISLLGVAAGSAREGIGKTLLQESLRWAAAQGAVSMEVVTQGRNYGAQRLYQGGGFKTMKVELWYHKWFDPD